MILMHYPVSNTFAHEDMTSSVESFNSRRYTPVYRIKQKKEENNLLEATVTNRHVYSIMLIIFYNLFFNGICTFITSQ